MWVDFVTKEVYPKLSRNEGDVTSIWSVSSDGSCDV